jgi:hypothetical protein
MPVRLIFRCEFCKRLPSEATRRSLEGQLLELEWGQFTDALPEGWLIWAGKGPYGQTRYACAEHRIELRDFIRSRELARGPAPKRVRTAHQRRLRRNSGFVM